MTTLTDEMERADRQAREVLAHAIASGVHCPNMVTGYRGELMAVTLTEGAGLSASRDTTLAAAYAAVRFFAADRLSVMFDTYTVSTPVSPLTGEKWRPGEMQHLVAEHPDLAAGVIQDAVALVVANSAGDLLMREIPYTVDGLTVDTERGVDMVTTGVIQRAILDALMRGPSNDLLPPDVLPLLAEMGMDSEEVRDAMDLAAARFLTEQGYVVALGADTGTARVSHLLEAEGTTVLRRPDGEEEGR